MGNAVRRRAGMWPSFLWVCCVATGGAQAQPLPWIDVHIHLLATDIGGAKVLAAEVAAFAQSEGMRTALLFPLPL